MAHPIASAEKMLLDLETADADSSSELLNEVSNRPSLVPRMTSLRRAAAILGSMALVGLLAGSINRAEVNSRRGRANVRAEVGLASAGLLTNTNDKHDGNVCRDDEEQNGLLCYKKCSILTGGEYPIRTSGVTCCKAEPCGFTNQKHDIGFCSGYSVGGGSGGSCPHAPGACMNDEEMHVGQCYEKCSILTNNMYPFRSGPDTCCKYNNEMMCIPGSGHTKSSFDYAVGGGKGDGSKSTPGSIHAPIAALTEAQPTTTTVTETTTEATTTVTTASKAAPEVPDWAQEMAPVAKSSKTTTEKPIASTTSKSSQSKDDRPPIPDWAADIIQDPNAGADGQAQASSTMASTFVASEAAPAAPSTTRATGSSDTYKGYVAVPRVATDSSDPVSTFSDAAMQAGSAAPAAALAGDATVAQPAAAVGAAPSSSYSNKIR